MANSVLLRLAQQLIVWTLRPYVSRELPGWGYFCAVFTDYRRDWLWRGAPIKEMRGRKHGYVTRLDLSKWPDRSTYFLGRWYDLELQAFVSDVVRPTDTIIDIGANRGEFTLFASRCVEQGKVIAFEPNPHCLKILHGDVDRNSIRNVRICPVGLGDHAASLILSVPAHNSGEGTFAFSMDSTVDRFEVQVKTGDELLSEEWPSLIKIDVEGFECKVIAGLAQTITRCQPIIITEIFRSNLERCGATSEELRSLLESFGYKGFRLRLVKHNGTYVWALMDFDITTPVFDAVWLHSEHKQIRLRPPMG